MSEGCGAGRSDPDVVVAGATIVGDRLLDDQGLGSGVWKKLNVVSRCWIDHGPETSRAVSAA